MRPASVVSGCIPTVQTCLLDSLDTAIPVWGRPLWGHSKVEWKSIRPRLTGSLMGTLSIRTMRCWAIGKGEQKFRCWLRLGA
jgi:hypothetical protein